jgi:hypothetical protein
VLDPERVTLARFAHVNVCYLPFYEVAGCFTALSYFLERRVLQTLNLPVRPTSTRIGSAVTRNLCHKRNNYVNRAHLRAPDLQQSGRTQQLGADISRIEMASLLEHTGLGLSPVYFSGVHTAHSNACSTCKCSTAAHPLLGLVHCSSPRLGDHDAYTSSVCTSELSCTARRLRSSHQVR